MASASGRSVAGYSSSQHLKERATGARSPREYRDEEDDEREHGHEAHSPTGGSFDEGMFRQAGSPRGFGSAYHGGSLYHRVLVRLGLARLSMDQFGSRLVLLTGFLVILGWGVRDVWEEMKSRAATQGTCPLPREFRPPDEELLGRLPQYKRLVLTQPMAVKYLQLIHKYLEPWRPIKDAVVRYQLMDMRIELFVNTCDHSHTSRLNRTLSPFFSVSPPLPSTSFTTCQDALPLSTSWRTCAWSCSRTHHPFSSSPPSPFTSLPPPPQDAVVRYQLTDMCIELFVNTCDHSCRCTLKLHKPPPCPQKTNSQDTVVRYQLIDMRIELFVNTCDHPMAFYSSHIDDRPGIPMMSTGFTADTMDIPVPDPLDLTEDYTPDLATQVGEWVLCGPVVPLCALAVARPSIPMMSIGFTADTMDIPVPDPLDLTEDCTPDLATQVGERLLFTADTMDIPVPDPLDLTEDYTPDPATEVGEWAVCCFTAGTMDIPVPDPLDFTEDYTPDLATQVGERLLCAWVCVCVCVCVCVGVCVCVCVRGCVCVLLYFFSMMAMASPPMMAMASPPMMAMASPPMMTLASPPMRHSIFMMSGSALHHAWICLSLTPLNFTCEWTSDFATQAFLMPLTFRMLLAPCPMPHAPYSMPHASCPILRAPCLMPHTPCPMPHAPYLMPHTPCPMPHAPCPMPHTPLPMPDALRRSYPVGAQGGTGSVPWQHHFDCLGSSKTPSMPHSPPLSPIPPLPSPLAPRKQIPWERKEARAVFRGKTTSYHLIDGNWGANPRIRLHRISDAHPSLMDAHINRRLNGSTNPHVRASAPHLQCTPLTGRSAGCNGEGRRGDSASRRTLTPLPLSFPRASSCPVPPRWSHSRGDAQDAMVKDGAVTAPLDAHSLPSLLPPRFVLSCPPQVVPLARGRAGCNGGGRGEDSAAHGRWSWTMNLRNLTHFKCWWTVAGTAASSQPSSPDSLTLMPLSPFPAHGAVCGVCSASPRWSHSRGDAQDAMVKDGVKTAPRMNFTQFNAFKYQVLVDGGGGSCRTCGVLRSNQLSIRQETPIFQFYEPLLQDRVHWLTTTRTFSDLTEKVRWAQENDEEVQRLVQAANQFATYACTWTGRTLYWGLMLVKYYDTLQNPDAITEPPVKQICDKR
ncbi:unnamed protein product [Closterium sp. NIES-54]